MFHHYILSMMHGAIFVEGNSCVFIFLWIFYSLRLLRILLALFVTDFTRFARYGFYSLCSLRTQHAASLLGEVRFICFVFLRTQHAVPSRDAACCVWVIVFLLFANSFLKYLCYSWVREHHFFELVNCHASFDCYTCCRYQF